MFVVDSYDDRDKYNNLVPNIKYICTLSSKLYSNVSAIDIVVS